MASYRTKQIQFHGTRHILTQNSNGPCALLGLTNTLLLTCDEHSPSSVHDLVVLVNSVDSVGEMELLNGMQKILEERGVYDDRVASLFTKLADGLVIDPRFDGGFEKSVEVELFELFGIGIVHGWIIDPEDAEYKSVTKYGSYEAAQRVLIEAYEVASKPLKDEVDEEIMADSELIKHFFARTATQLTDYGLQYLRNTLREGEILCFFRNNHFNTIIKAGNDIYQLVTDQGFADRKQFVWESLLSINGANNSFFTGDFSPLMEDSSDPFSDTSPQEDEDRRIAMMMQQEEDERTAAAMQKKYQKKPKPQSQQEEQSQDPFKDKKSKKHKKCIIM